MVARTIETDYLVVGAGAMGMAFTDALIDHADVHVTLVDRRDVAGGHWQDAYPFVRLHQASLFYGVASTELGTGKLQHEGPEAGLHERALQPEILAYFDDILQRRFVGPGCVTFLGGHEYREADGRHQVTSIETGETIQVDVRRRVVDATYLSPEIPATSPPPFGVAEDVRVVPVNALPDVGEEVAEYVIVGSGKTATDAIVWLLTNGVAPDRILWVRPRDPWMLDRAAVQPDPVVAFGLSRGILASAIDATTTDEMFLRLEAAGVLVRIDPDVTPTMAKAPTIGRWEVALLRSVERVVRFGHIRQVRRGEMELERGRVALSPDCLVVHCAASGIAYPPVMPIWSPDRIRLQTIRAGFPCYCAALAGFVEATRDDDRERNRLCPPNRLPDMPQGWPEMHMRGILATRTYEAEPDIAVWANRCALNPARVTPDRAEDPGVIAARARVAEVAEPGLAGLTRLAGMARAGAAL